MYDLGCTAADVQTEQIDEALACQNEIRDLSRVGVLNFGHLEDVLWQLVGRLTLLRSDFEQDRSERLLCLGLGLAVVEVQELTRRDPNSDGLIRAESQHETDLVSD